MHDLTVLVDVDGPLNPFLMPPGDIAPGYRTYRAPGRALLLNPDHGTSLLALGARLVWASDMEEDANVAVSLALGLPRLDVCPLPQDADERSLNRKTEAIARFAGGGPFVWIDDEVDAPDARWLSDKLSVRALLLRADPATGLVDEDFRAIKHWMANPDNTTGVTLR